MDTEEININEVKEETSTQEVEEVTETQPTSWQWAPDAKIEITGLEYDALQRIVKGLYEPSVIAANQIFERMKQQGVAVPMKD